MSLTNYNLSISSWPQGYLSHVLWKRLPFFFQLLAAPMNLLHPLVLADHFVNVLHITAAFCCNFSFLLTSNTLPKPKQPALTSSKMVKQEGQRSQVRVPKAPKYMNPARSDMLIPDPHVGIKLAKSFPASPEILQQPSHHLEEALVQILSSFRTASHSSIGLQNLRDKTRHTLQSASS